MGVGISIDNARVTSICEMFEYVMCLVFTFVCIFLYTLCISHIYDIVIKYLVIIFTLPPNRFSKLEPSKWSDKFTFNALGRSALEAVPCEGAIET